MSYLAKLEKSYNCALKHDQKRNLTLNSNEKVMKIEKGERSVEESERFKKLKLKYSS